MARVAKCSGPRCPCAAAPARGTCHLVQQPAALHQERGHQFVPPGGSSEAPVSCWSTFKVSTSPHGTRSQVPHTQQCGGCRAHSSPNKVQRLNDGLHTRGLGGGDGGSRVLCVSSDQTSGCSLQAALTSWPFRAPGVNLGLIMLIISIKHPIIPLFHPTVSTVPGPRIVGTQ